MALRLARRTGGEIINADSMQLYNELRVLTARPSRGDEAAAPHHLFAVAAARDAWSVGRWLRSASSVLAEIQDRNRTAIFVGGTGLYFRALTRGLAPIPAIPTEMRAQVSALLAEQGEPALRERLTSVDSESAARILPGDGRRLTRALEVFLATGRTLSQWREATVSILPIGSWRGVVLAPPTDCVYRRCDARFVTMISAGAVEETRALLGLGLAPNQPALKALGVGAIAAHLRGEIDLAAAISRAQAQTRRYVKRQMTWFRHQSPDWPRIEAASPAAQWTALITLNRALTSSA